MALGLTLDRPLTIYRFQFPVMRKYEADTWYDANGRIVLTASKGFPSIGLPRKAVKGNTNCTLRTREIDQIGIPLGWENIRDLTNGVIISRILDDTLPGGTTERAIEYHAPFDRCDRERDYRFSWTAFDRRFEP